MPQPNVYLVFIAGSLGDHRTPFLDSVWTSKKKATEQVDLLKKRDVGTPYQLMVAMVEVPTSFQPQWRENPYVCMDSLPWEMAQ